MTIEQKAKAYDEALEWMRELYPGLHGATKEGAEHYFPELKESKDNEDERIRKEIISFIQDEIDLINGRVSGDYDDRDEDDIEHQNWCRKAIVYLERQKEQKPSINIDQLKSLMLQYLQEAANKKDDSDIQADTDKWARKILGYDFEQKPEEWNEDIIRKGIKDVGLTQYQINWLKNNVFPPKEEQKPEVKLTGWVARDKEFDSYLGLGLIFFDEKPRRSFDTWSGEIVSQLPWRLFPDLKWEDEPMEVEVTITKK